MKSRDFSGRDRSLAAAAVWSLWWAASCADPGQGGAPPSADTAKASADVVLFDVPKGGDAAGDGTADSPGADGSPSDSGSAGDGGAGGLAILTFEVDDSANKTFADGEIVWTGSFSWDSKTNTVVYATSWLPTDGPYPALYDDGAFSKGGHEREGATKGDHIFSTQVLFHASADTTIEYGALNELGNWMWIGPNGQVPIAKGKTGVVAFPGIKIAKHGAIDLKVALDTAKLNAKMAKWNLKDFAFYIKGSMNMWTPIQLLDDGQKGDEKAGDGVLTYQHKLNLGKHDGGLNAGDEAQFVFVTTQGDQLPDAGQEYKGATEAYKDGIAAWTNTGAAGAWAAAEVVLAKDSKGKFLNTAVKVPKPTGTSCEPNCPCSPACAVNEDCQNGKCVAKTPVCSPACAADQTCEAGKCVAKAPACQPACKPGESCDAGKCVAKVPTCEPTCKAGEACVEGKCTAPQSKPTVLAVDPSKGTTLGGDAVTVSGSALAADAKVWFGATLASAVQVDASGKSLNCKTPPHAAGLVDVSVHNGDGGKAVLPQGFSYQMPPKPTVVLGAVPADGLVAAGGSLTLTAHVTIAGVTSAPGVTPDLTVAIGLGPVGADPVAQSGSFSWKAANYAEKDGDAEKFSAQLSVGAPGSYQAVAKASWKAEVALSAGATLTAVDPKDLPATLTGVEPAFAAAAGGAVVLATGTNLPASAVAVFTPTVGPAKPASAVKAVVGGLELTVPALPLGLAQLTIATASNKPIGAALPFHAVAVATPAVDGVIGTDWPAGAVGTAQNGVATSWGAGKNELKTLWIAFDKTHLYLGIAGTVEAANAIVAYLDVDYGATTGVAGPLQLQDNSGAVDDAIASAAKGAEAGLGLDFAMATLGMASFDGADLSKSTAAGWRGLQKPSDFAWLAGTVKAGAGAVEASIALKTLYPQGVPAGGAELRVVVVLGNANGAAISNQFLPEQVGQPDAVTWTKTLAIKVVALP
ncbi:MAG: IPT/TIG domain-containing protein [Deltaproteobacteria bacterium]|nr:IPT/TIG domain-containing protein [Deltaproteobacteria bacterium]